MKTIWEDMKKNFISMMFVATVSFGLGQMWAYASIGTDCRVLGMFRIAEIAVDCRISKV